MTNVQNTIAGKNSKLRLKLDVVNIKYLIMVLKLDWPVFYVLMKY